MMKKICLLSMVLVLVLALGVSATTNMIGNLSITNETTSLKGNVSDSLTGNFSVSNIGTTNFSKVNLASTKFESNSGKYNISAASFSPNNVYNDLNVGQSADFQFTINIPANAYADTYTGTISATDDTGNNKDNFTVSLEVEETEAMTATLPAITSVVPGEQATTKLTLENTGNTDLAISIVKDDAKGSTSDIAKSNIGIESISSVAYSKTEEVEITVDVPADQAKGTYRANITVNYGSKTLSKFLDITVVEKLETATVTSNPSVTWARGLSTSETVKVTVENTGNVDLSGVSVYLKENLASGSNTIDKTNVEVISSPFNLAKGAKKDVTLKLTGVASDQALGTYTSALMVDFAGKNISTTYSVVIREPARKLDVPSSVELGGSDQRKQQTFTKTFNVTNSGDYSLTNVKFSSTAAASYLVKFSEDGTNYYDNLSVSSISKADQKTIYVQAFAPETMDSGTVDIGDIVVTGDEGISASISSFKITTKTFLKITDGTIYIDGDDEGLSNGDVIDDIRPGSKIKIEFEITNMFSEDLDEEKDMDIDNIEVTVESKDEIGDDEIDETSEELELKPEDDDTVTVEFTIDEEADEDTYEFTAKVVGEDKENADHEDVWTFSLKVEKEDDMVDIYRLELSDDTLTCARDTILSVSIRNLGQDDEDEARLKITSTELDIAIDNRDIELSNDVGDDDNEYDFTLPIELDDDVKKGTYKIIVESFYEDTKRSETEEIFLTVDECTSSSSSSASSGSSSTSDQTGSMVIQTPTQSGSTTTSQTTTPTAAPPVTVTETTAASFRNSSSYTILLVAALVVVVAAIIMLVMKGFPPKYRY